MFGLRPVFPAAPRLPDMHVMDMGSEQGARTHGAQSAKFRRRLTAVNSTPSALKSVRNPCAARVLAAKSPQVSVRRLSWESHHSFDICEAGTVLQAAASPTLVRCLYLLIKLQRLCCAIKVDGDGWRVCPPHLRAVQQIEWPCECCLGCRILGILPDGD